MKRLVENIILQIETIHYGNAWIGVSYKKKLQLLTEYEFFYQFNGNHSIAEIISHVTTWREETILKIKSGAGSITDADPSNWKNISNLKKTGMKGILSSHDKSITALLNLLKDKNDDFLAESYYDNDFKDYYPYKFVIEGMLHHDIYHLGQIGLIMKLLPN